MADNNATLHCSVLTPEGPVFQGEARSVSAPGSDGELGILRNHAPIITSLAFGSLKVRTADDGDDRGTVQECGTSGGQVAWHPVDGRLRGPRVRVRGLPGGSQEVTGMC